VSGSGICWAICKSAPHPRQPCQHPTTQFFTGWMPFLPPNQQCQSTEGKLTIKLTLEIHRVALFHAKIYELTTWLTRRVNLPVLLG